MPEYGQPLDPEEEARKKKAAQDTNPLLQYFGGEQAQPIAKAPQAGRPVAPTPAAQAPTNVGGGANTGSAAAQQPSPTGFTNFSRIAAANRDVSAREAGAYAGRAADKAMAARRNLDALRARFGASVESGTVQGPQEGFAPQAEGEGLMGEGTRQTMAPGMTSSAMYAEGGRKYSGPGGLGDDGGIADTYASTLAAEQNLNALQSEGGLSALIQQQNAFGNEGTSKLSGALIGSEGRGDFDALRQRFNPESDIATAEQESAAQAKAAGDTSTTNAAKWRTLGDSRKAAEESQAQAGATAQQAKDLKPKVEAAYAALGPTRPGKAWGQYTDTDKEAFITTLTIGNKAQGAYNGLKLDNWDGLAMSKEDLRSVIDSLTPEEFERVATGVNNSSAANRAVIYPYLMTKHAYNKAASGSSNKHQ